MRIYLDSCALSREYDLPSHPRVEDEAKAVSRVFDSDFTWIASSVLLAETEAINDDRKRGSLLTLLEEADEFVAFSENILLRAKQLIDRGFGVKDSFHLASAEHANADVFLTTDDRLLRRANKLGRAIGVQVENPVDWVLRSL